MFNAFTIIIHFKIKFRKNINFIVKVHYGVNYEEIRFFLDRKFQVNFKGIFIFLQIIKLIEKNTDISKKYKFHLAKHSSCKSIFNNLAYVTGIKFLPK